MEKTIANRRPTLEEIEFSKRAGTVHEAERRIINAGGFDLFQRTIDDPMFLADLLKFHRTYVPSALGYAAFLKWLQDNKLEKHLVGGGLEKQITQQETFYQKFYGKKFKIDRKKIFVDPSRLPAIKAGLEAGCINCVLAKATPNTLTETEAQMTEAEFFFERLMSPLKEDGFKIWAETGTDRWTKLTLAELLHRCNPAEPEELDAEAFKKDWVAEEMRLVSQKGSAPKVQAGMVEIIFTSSAVDIPHDQTIVSKDGAIVKPDDPSYVSAIANKVRVISHAEGSILASQMYAKNKTLIASNTWEWRRDLVKHDDKDINTPCSVALALSSGSEFSLDSSHADFSAGYFRLRLAL